MKRRLPGLSKRIRVGEEPPAGRYLVELTRARYCWQKKKPFLAIAFRVLQPGAFAGGEISTRLYCTAKELWKLSWFLSDFGYDTDSLERDEIDEKKLRGLRGVVHVTYTNTSRKEDGCSLDGFAPVGRWNDIASPLDSRSLNREIA